MSGKAGGVTVLLGEIPACTLAPSLLGELILCNFICHWPRFEAGLRMSRVGEEEGGKARGATIMKEPCAVTQGFGSESSGKDRC